MFANHTKFLSGNMMRHIAVMSSMCVIGILRFFYFYNG